MFVLLKKAVLGLILLVGVISVVLYQFERGIRGESTGRIGQNNLPVMDHSFLSSDSSVKKIIINTAEGGTYEYKTLLADTPVLRQKGLSGRASIDVGEAMLFIFEKSARNYFWMRDMLFSIDIVWLDTDKKVIHIERDVSPDSFPKSFGPDEDSKYVLEFKEGLVESIGLKVGDKVVF